MAFAAWEHQPDRASSVNIVTAKQQSGKMMQHAQFTQRVLHLTDRPVGYHAHRRLYALQQGICARDRFQFGIEQTRNLGAVGHRL